MATETTNKPTAAESAADLAHSIMRLRDERTANTRRVSPQDHPRASAVGPCAREVYHQIVDWQMRKAPDVPLLQRFQRGNEVESIVVRELLQDGFQVHAQQIAFEIREKYLHVDHEHGDGAPFVGDIIICRGHMDGRIAWGDDNPVFEVKSLNPNVWGRINDVRDFFALGNFWVKYPRQMLLYLYQAAEPYGLFILDDCLGHWKILTVVLDDFLDECEDALQVCRAAAIGAENANPPPYYRDPTWCLECWCREAGVCTPPMDFTPERFIEIHSEDVAHGIWHIEQARSARDEFKFHDDWVKETMKLYGPGTYVAGDWLITVKEQKNGTRVTWKRCGACPQNIPHEDIPL